MKNNGNFLSILVRYVLMLFPILGGLWIIYSVFTPLTVYPVFFLLNLFFNVSLEGVKIYSSSFIVAIIESCVAGSAYYLLFALNLSVPKIKISKRIKMIIFAFTVFLIVNILRIFILTSFLVAQSSIFDFSHKFFWYFLSTVFVAGIWFLEVHIFKIKAIPFFSDAKFLFSQIKKQRRVKK